LAAAAAASDVQGCERSGVDGDDVLGPMSTNHSANNMATSTGVGDSKKSASSLDFKVDVTIPMSGSFADR
jgi:hypothetical protein